MPSENKVIVTVKEVRGECPIHKVGDTIELSGVKQMKGHICPTALYAIYLHVLAMRYGAEFPYPWAQHKDSVLVCCNDPFGVVVFELNIPAHARAQKLAHKASL